MAAIQTEFVSGDLAEVLRNYVDELAIRHQSGSDTVPDDAGIKAVTFANAMPDTDYEVLVTMGENAVDPVTVWVDTKTTTGFVFNTEVGDIGGTNLDFSYIARHNGRLNTKANGAPAQALATVEVDKEFYSGVMADALRNFADELAVRTQSGSSLISNNVTGVTIPLPTAFPDTNYEVFVTANENPAADIKNFYVLDSNKTATTFGVSVEAHPGATNVDFSWMVRHNTRLNAKSESGSALVIGKEFFSGDVADVLRNFVDELSIRTQHGAVTAANGIQAAAVSVAITFPTAMPSTDYEVIITGNNVPSNDVNEIWVDTKTTTGFTVNVEDAPGANKFGFAWLARHNGRLNTKG